MATELGPTPVKEPASGGAPVRHAPKGVGEDNVIASQGRWAAWLLAPTVIALGIVIVYPIISAVIMSFQQDAGLDPVTGMFSEGGSAGFSNYVHWIFQQCAAPGGGTVACPPGTLGAQFWSATGTTFFFAIVNIGYFFAFDSSIFCFFFSFSLFSSRARRRLPGGPFPTR